MNTEERPMLKDFVEIFLTHKDELNCNRQHPSCYKDLVTDLVRILNRYLPELPAKYRRYDCPHPDHVTEIQFPGSNPYVGYILYVIGTDDPGYPYLYWYTTVFYGSCPGCDTLQGIKGTFCNEATSPTPQQVKDYLTLSLHLVQKMRELDVPSESYED